MAVTCPCYMTVAEFFDSFSLGSGTISGLSCAQRKSTMNVALLYLAGYESFSYDLVAEPLADPSVDEDVTITTDNPVVDVYGFYGTGQCANYNDTCSMCSNNPACKTGRFTMKQVYGDVELCAGQFRVDCPYGTSITYRLPAGITNAYLLYHAGYNKITSDDDCMPVRNPLLFPAVRHYLMHMTAPYSGAIAEGDADFYIDLFEKDIKRAKQADGAWMQRIFSAVK